MNRKKGRRLYLWPNGTLDAIKTYSPRQKYNSNEKRDRRACAVTLHKFVSEYYQIIYFFGYFCDY